MFGECRAAQGSKRTWLVGNRNWRAGGHSLVDRRSVGAPGQLGQFGDVVRRQPSCKFIQDIVNGGSAAIVDGAAYADDGCAGHNHFERVLAGGDAAGPDNGRSRTGPVEFIDTLERNWFEGRAADAAAAVGKDGLAAFHIDDHAGHRVNGA